MPDPMYGRVRHGDVGGFKASGRAPYLIKPYLTQASLTSHETLLFLHTLCSKRTFEMVLSGTGWIHSLFQGLTKGLK